MGAGSDWPQAQRVSGALLDQQTVGRGRGAYFKPIEISVQNPDGTISTLPGFADTRGTTTGGTRPTLLGSSGQPLPPDVMSRVIGIKDPRAQYQTEFAKGSGGALGTQAGQMGMGGPYPPMPRQGMPAQGMPPQAVQPPPAAMPMPTVAPMPTAADVAGSKKTAETAAEQGLSSVLTPAEKAIDSAFAKEYQDYVVGGGSAHTEKGLTQLQGVVDKLEENVRLVNEGKTPKVNYSGEVMSARPGDWWWKREYPEGAMMEGTVQEVVQERLRPILGGQFGEKEGDRLIARAYDRTSPEEMNLKRVKRLLKAARQAAESKSKAVKWFEENGTLKGFKGKLWTVSDLEDAIGSDDQENNDLFNEADRIINQ
jgi:hypothetical protein